MIRWVRSAGRWRFARSSGQPSLLCGDPLSLVPGELWVDVRALEDGSLPVQDIGGDLLEGIELRNCPGFDTWLLLARLASCEMLFAREGLVSSPALRSAARDPELAPRPRLRAGVIAVSLLRAGTAALDAGAVDAGVETLRRAVQEAGRAGEYSMAVVRRERWNAFLPWP